MLPLHGLRWQTDFDVGVRGTLIPCTTLRVLQPAITYRHYATRTVLSHNTHINLFASFKLFAFVARLYSGMAFTAKGVRMCGYSTCNHLSRRIVLRLRLRAVRRRTEQT